MIKYIAVAGTMGSGKSSLVKFLCNRYKDIRPFYERNEENPYLADFYEEMKRWAFHSQIYFLALKFRTHQQLDACGQTVIQDRTIYEDAEVFAMHLHKKGILTGRDYEAYRRLYSTILNSINPPDLLIYMKTNLRTVKKRIAKRGRDYESSIDTEYLKGLNALYKSWIKKYREAGISPVVEVDASRMDFLHNLVDRIELLEVIEKHL
ncbi:MAG: deoxynucleoside kinase [Deltaproteobacteria bacterium]|nr:MAG: deoxynucleoside kinase [Deltaproteobacteria bacterium]